MPKTLKLVDKKDTTIEYKPGDTLTSWRGKPAVFRSVTPLHRVMAAFENCAEAEYFPSLFNCRVIDTSAQ